MYLGDGKKFLSEEYLKALTPLALAIWYMDDGSFALRSKGLQQRTQGGSGRIEICVEAMRRGSRERLADISETLMDWMSGCEPGWLGWQGSAGVLYRGDGEVPELVAPHAPVHGVQAAAAVPRSGKVKPQFDVEPTQRLMPARGCSIPRQAAYPIDESVRYRGRRQP